MIHAKIIEIVNKALTDKGVTYLDRKDKIEEIVNDVINVSEDQFKEYEIDLSEDTSNGVCNRAIVEEVVKDHISKEDNKTEDIFDKLRSKEVDIDDTKASISLEDVLNEIINLECNKKAEDYSKKYDLSNVQSKVKKEHGKQLRFKSNDTKVIFSEIEDLGKMIRLGYNWSSTPVRFKCSKCDKQIPFISMKVDEITNKVFCEDNCNVAKRVKKIKKLRSNCRYDTKIICQSILVNTHHIVVTDADVIELRETVSKLMGYLNLKVTDTELEDLTKDIICKLGTDTNYENGNITYYINSFVRLLHNANIQIPRYVALLLYDKIYELTWRNVSFWNKEEQYLSSYCQNEDSLKQKANEEMTAISSYSLAFFKSKNLYPVEDAISDYRPYVKVLQSYQGIKPDLLCRMMNLIVNQDDSFTKFITGCGGSGADTINRFHLPDNIKNEVYNEYGYLLTNFFKVLQDKKSYTKLVQLTDEFIRYIIFYSVDAINSGSLKEFTQPIYNGVQTIKKLKIGPSNKLNAVEELFDKYNSTAELGAEDRDNSNEKHNGTKFEKCQNELFESPNIIKLLYSNPIVYKYYMDKWMSRLCTTLMTGKI